MGMWWTERNVTTMNGKLFKISVAVNKIIKFMRKELGLLHQILIFLYYIHLIDSIETLSMDVRLGFVFTIDSGSIFSVLFLVNSDSPLVDLLGLVKSIIFLYLFFLFPFPGAIGLPFSATIYLLLMVKQYKQYKEGFPSPPWVFHVCCFSPFF